jgi:hypothetical protein
MPTKSMRDAREKNLKAAMELFAKLGGSTDLIVTNILDVLDDIDGAMEFVFAQWKRGGPLLDLEPGQKLGRWETTVRLNQRMDRDPGLYAEMRREPRYMAALIEQEAKGLPPIGFLGQVREVRVVEEKPGLHWMLLPACHHGCDVAEKPQDAQEAQPEDSCSVCGRPTGAGGCSPEAPASAVTTLDRIHVVDEYLTRSMDASAAIRDSVMKDPTEAFAQATQTLFGASPEELFGIHETKLGVETDTMIYTIRLADHQPKRIVTSPGSLPREAEAMG